MRDREKRLLDLHNLSYGLRMGLDSDPRFRRALDRIRQEQEEEAEEQRETAQKGDHGANH